MSLIRDGVSKRYAICSLFKQVHNIFMMVCLNGSREFPDLLLVINRVIQKLSGILNNVPHDVISYAKRLFSCLFGGKVLNKSSRSVPFADESRKCVFRRKGERLFGLSSVSNSI